jgi:hypothetical protein
MIVDPMTRFAYGKESRMIDLSWSVITQSKSDILE